MTPSPSPVPIIDAAAARLAQHYKAHGDLELNFIRQIASTQITFDSLQRALDKLNSADDPNDARIDRISRAQLRSQRMQTIALKELKDLQSRRNAIELFPIQTNDLPPLADQMPFIGFKPKVVPIPDAATLARITNPFGAALAATRNRDEFRLPRGFEHFPNKEPFLKRMAENAPGK